MRRTADRALRVQLVAASLGGGVMAPDAAVADPQRGRDEVLAAERAFARSMAERNHAAFVDRLSEQAVFFGRAAPLRGKAAVAAGWKPYFEGPEAPFSCESDQVEGLDDGTLALSTGPVRDPAGKPIARVNSIWRLEASGVWRVVFDKGEPWRD
ncbi:MAG: DUF4440 domain-containing protein [Rubrivivax sp.]